MSSTTTFDPTAYFGSQMFSSNYDRLTGGASDHIALSMCSLLSSPLLTEPLRTSLTSTPESETNQPVYPPITEKSYILDLACGTGIVTGCIKYRYPFAKIHATDFFPAMLAETDRRVEKEGWSTTVTTGIADMTDMKDTGDGVFTHIFSNLALFMLGDGGAAVKAGSEMYRVLKKDGVALVSTWCGEHFVSSMSHPFPTPVLHL